MIPTLKKNLISPIAGVALCSMLALSACKEPPISCYTPSKTLVDVNEPVSFENCTEPAGKSYEWDFGDGTSSTEVSPIHTYTHEGQFIVGLTAKAGSSINDDVTKTIISAGQRLLVSASIQSLPSTNPSGGAWDPSDNPDIAVRFSQGSTPIHQSTTIQNAAWTFPMAMPTPPLPAVVLTPDTWTISILDIDIDDFSEEVMATFTVNLATLIPIPAKTISLTQNLASIQVTYSLR